MLYIEVICKFIISEDLSAMILAVVGEVEKVVQGGVTCMVESMIVVVERDIAVHPGESSVHHINA